VVELVLLVVEVVLVGLMLPVKAVRAVLLVLLEIPVMHLYLVLLYSLCPEDKEVQGALLEMQAQQGNLHN
jgi:hypothetical protein